MKSIKYIIAILILMTLSSAQEKLTLEKAVSIALEKNFSIKISRKNAEISKNNAHPGRAGLLPRVDLSADIHHTDVETKTALAVVSDNSTLTSAGISTSYTLFNGLSNFNNYDKLKKLGKVGELQNRLVIENTILNVVQSYYNLALFKENTKIAMEALEISQKRFDRVFNQNKYGSANKIEVLNAQVDLSSDSVNYFNTKLLYDDAKRNLSVLLNRNQDDNYEIDPSVIFEKVFEYKTLLSKTMQNNSELLLANEDVQIADLDKSIAGAGYMPTIDLSASYGYNQREPNWRVGMDDPNSSFSAKLSLRYNLFNGKQTDIQNQNATIALENKKLSFADTRNKIERDLANAFNAYKNNLFILDVQKRNLKTAEANFNRTQELYKLGQATTIMFREAQLNLIRSKNSYTSAKFNAKNAEVKVLKISGELIK